MVKQIVDQISTFQYPHRYMNNNKELEHVFEGKDLGVFIDLQLSSAEHISSKVWVANAIVCLISRSYSYMDGNSFKKMYTAFVRPHSEYAQAVWAPHSQKYVKHAGKCTDSGDESGWWFWKSRLPGKTTWKDYLERLPGKTTWKDYIERLPGKTTWKDYMERLPGKTT